MQPIQEANLAARGARVRLPRDFLSITPRDRSTGDPVTLNFWSGLYDITAAVYNPDTGVDENRTFKAAGSLIAISQIVRTANLTVQTVAIEMSGAEESVDQLFRQYDAKLAPVEIWRGEQDASTRAMVASAEPRFFGRVETIPVDYDEFGGDVKVTINCKSHSSQTTRANYAKVSSARQKLRSATDTFLDDVAQVGEWEAFWGLDRNA